MNPDNVFVTKKEYDDIMKQISENARKAKTNAIKLSLEDQEKAKLEKLVQEAGNLESLLKEQNFNEQCVRVLTRDIDKF